MPLEAEGQTNTSWKRRSDCFKVSFQFWEGSGAGHRQPHTVRCSLKSIFVFWQPSKDSPPSQCQHLCASLPPSSSSSSSQLVHVVHLHNAILRCREKEGAYTLCNSMDGTGEHYTEWNKPGSEGQIPYDLTLNWNIINRRKKQTKYTQRHWN